MGLFSNKISRNDLHHGDHIYSWRAYYSYAHHGIYIGDGKVIHFTRGEGQEVGTGTILDNFFASRAPPRSSRFCDVCRQSRENSNGVVVSCVDCFLNGWPLYKFEYGVDAARFFVKARGGTCTLARSDPPEEVLHRALYLLDNGFGGYHLFRNNCEDFAMYCKTGLLLLDENLPGRSGQTATMMLGIPAAAVLLYPASLVVGAGVYCLSRYAIDLGIRQDVVKVPVEDLAANLGWSPPVLSSKAAIEWAAGKLLSIRAYLINAYCHPHDRLLQHSLVIHLFAVSTCVKLV
ncbi:hypothetical protein GOP47_0008337 [Adiantum capillus-veneris]|uniref:LRAT domain-containing protein n=1 Tax=Adiantum capillus-veneris TaxID=13818 RepID=A0A9D4UZJ8_ADICA|nr:hypothetical protein GOP47_0008337 [Adiantum capillus-veneris]